MALTDNCDLYVAVHEDAVNLVARHIMSQRPSLFNYATAYIAAHPGLACAEVVHTSDIDAYNNALFTVEGPLPLLGVDAPPVGLNFSAQLVDAEIDFYPGNVFTLPADLNPPLAGQHLAVRMRICLGIDCPPIELIDGIQPWPPSQHPVQPGPKGGEGTGGETKGSQPIVPPSRKLLCFCLDAFAIGHVEVTELFGEATLVGHVDAVDVVGIAPKGLHQAIDCYLRTTAELLLREKLSFPVVKTFLPHLSFLALPQITVTLAPNPPVPDNPALQDNQCEIFIDVKVGP